ncbi:MAG: hypothetical protein ACYDCK_13045 [Thermoplasmatota archaeon]
MPRTRTSRASVIHSAGSGKKPDPTPIHAPTRTSHATSGRRSASKRMSSS